VDSDGSAGFKLALQIREEFDWTRVVGRNVPIWDRKRDEAELVELRNISFARQFELALFGWFKQ
jgi:hypothetical protein